MIEFKIDSDGMSWICATVIVCVLVMFGMPTCAEHYKTDTAPAKTKESGK